MVEFSRIYDLSLPSTLMHAEKIIANDDECKALATRFKILSVDDLTAEFKIYHDAEEQCFKVVGHLHSKIQQASIVSLAPVAEEINVPIQIKIRLESDSDANDEDMDEGYSLEDTEFIANTKVDIGELVAQYLSLSMEAYPKNEGEHMEGYSESDPEEMTSQKSPFSVLSTLKKE